MAHASDDNRVPLEPYRVVPGGAPALRERDAGDTGPFDSDHDGKKLGKRRRKALRKRLAALQRLFYADGRYSVLVVLQAMDTGGKDSTVRRVFHGVNPQGVDVTSFKAPTSEELAHDFLWRVHRHAPAAGRIAVFNRSHYEDVLVARVEGLVPEAVWRPRYQIIREFEAALAEAGTVVCKFFLHIDADEQKERLQERLDDPDKRWKFDESDLRDRALWDEYVDAYEEALARTSTDRAVWTVVPANRKWFRDVVVLETLVDVLESLQLRYPPRTGDLEGIVVE